MKTKIHTFHDGDCTVYSSMLNNNCTDGICTCGYGHEYRYLNNGNHKHLFSKERLRFMKKEADKAWKKAGPNARAKAERLMRDTFRGKA